MNASHSADAVTLQQARGGDPAARALLLRQLQDPWFRICRSLLGGDEERSRDATQETALRFLRDLPRFDGRSSLMTWSIGIAINVTREMIRSEAQQRCRAPHPRLASALRAARGDVLRPDESASLEERHHRLRATLDELSDRQREALVLRFFEDLTVHETSMAMNCAPGTVKATVHQALRILRSRLRQLA